MRTRLLVGLVLLGLLAWGPTAGVLEPTGTVVQATGSATTGLQSAPNCTYGGLYNRTIDSVVTVRVLTNGSGFSEGSGFVYDEQGHVITNEHVVANGTTVEVQFDQGEWRTATVVGTDVFSDLAVLSVSDPPDYAGPLPTADRAAKPGAPVAALGSPLGLAGSITEGVVSGVDRSMPTEEGFTIPNTVQTDAAINPGNSGGPLVNCDGAVVGVNRAVAGINVGFAIPASTVNRVVPALVENGSYEHAYLGVSTLDLSPTVAEANGLNTTSGVLVVDVLPDSPASGVLQGNTSVRNVSGLPVPVGGDVVVAIDGKSISSSEGLASYLADRARPGQQVTLTVLRDGERRNVSVTLGSRPSPR